VAKKIAFMKLMQHPAYDCVIKTLAEHFPDLEIEEIDVRELLKKKRAVRWANMFFVFKEYGWEILLGRKAIRGSIWRTPYMFRKAKFLLSNLLSQGDYEFSFQFQALFDGSKKGVPHYVYTDHTHLATRHYPDFENMAFFGGAKGLYSRRWIELEKTIYHNATLTLTMSSNMTRSVIEDYACPPDKVVCVGGGSNVAIAFEVDEEKYKNKEILFVGFNWERKGGPELVEAFKRVLEVHPTARLTIVGCSPELNIPNCDVVGRVPMENVRQYYERASVFCLPSRLEPFGVVFLEAYAQDLPVVALDLGAALDLVVNGETGYRVDCGDVEQLSEVLIELLGDPEKCRTLGENGRRLLLEKYTWEKVCAEMATNIKTTMGK
jgi:glycosyltransferase involved in cell wall biosynthesis